MNPALEVAINKVRSAVDPEILLSKYANKIVRSSRDLRCQCPIHKGDGFNFSWGIENGWTCFSRHCGENSRSPRDAFLLVQLCEGVSFKESIKILADMFGVDLNDLDKFDKDAYDKCKIQQWLRHRRKFSREQNKLLDEQVLDSFIHKPHPYLKKRGFSDEAIELFEICYAKEGEFKNRIVVPIRDDVGNLVGFSGRIASDDKDIIKSYGKYKNMLDFNKGAVLYGLDKAKHLIAISEHPVPQSLVLAEGFFDVIHAWECGIFNIVASMGTSLLLEQIEIIIKHTSSVVLAYDGDDAGRNAQKRIYQQLKPYCDVYTISLPAGKDIGDLTHEELWNLYMSPQKPFPCAI